MTQYVRFKGFKLHQAASKLAFSALRLFGAEGVVDGDAVLSSSHQPVDGDLQSLIDGSAATGCSFLSEHVQAPGFYIQFALPDIAVPIGAALAGAAMSDACSAFDLYIWHQGRWSLARRCEGLALSGDSQSYDEALPLLNASRTTSAQAIADAGVGGSVLSVPLPGEGHLGDLLLLVVTHREAALTVPARWVLVASTGPAISSVGDIKQWTTVYASSRQLVEDESVPVAVSNAQHRSGVVVQVPQHGGVFGITAHADTFDGGVDIGSSALPLLPAADPGALLLSILTTRWAAAPGSGWVAESGEVVDALFLAGQLESPMQSRSDRIAIVARRDSVSGYLRTTSFVAGYTGGIGRVTLSIRPEVPVLVQGEVARSCSASRHLLGGKGAAVLHQGGMPTRAVKIANSDTEFGGQGCIYGAVELYAQSGNIPLPRRVRLHRSRDGMLVRETWSDAQGNYRFDGITDRYKYDVIAWDHEGLQQSVVANDLTPEPMQ